MTDGFEFRLPEMSYTVLLDGTIQEGPPPILKNNFGAYARAPVSYQGAGRMYSKTLSTPGLRLGASVFASLFLACCISAQEWRYYGGDPGGMRYSKLDQVNKKNVGRLAVTWIYDTNDYSDGTGASVTRSGFEATPLVVGNTMYVTTAFSRLIALRAETGELLWVFDPKIDRAMRANLFINRGATYWSNGNKSAVFFGDLEGRLWAVNAETGKREPEFGEGGMVDLKKGVVERYPRAQYRITSPPAVCGGVVITGSLVSDGEPRGPSGDVFAFDIHSGAPRWRFHSVPHKDEFGNDTWAVDSWRDRGGTNVWAPMSVDDRTQTVFLPLT